VTGAQLSAYADLAIRVALNLQAGQRLLIIGPIASGGVSLEAAPLVRKVAERAYAAGARYVETLWGDEALQLARFSHAPRDSFEEFSRWLPQALLEHVEAGDALLSISANDPDLLSKEPPELVSTVQKTVSQRIRAFREHISRNEVNWAVIAAPSRGWASRVFPLLPGEQQVPALWDALIRICRLDAPDPVGAWEKHLASLAARRDQLNRRRYDALKYSGPGTDLMLGLARGHVWVSGRTVSRRGVPFAANLPTEEVFSMPHKDRVDGTVRSTKPLSYGGTLIEDFTVRFDHGQIVEVHAARGEEVLRQLVATDDGAARLGEVALVPHSSPISQTGLLFYNTLLDENAASHLAVGSAYRFTMNGGEDLDPLAFALAGGNSSALHVDFMIGSNALDIDGVMDEGSVEPLMRAGEWVTG
jgi:aminopeptidase